ncbi:hypothetical protein AAVH_27853 [Aphelenchoides avenae]|nr:hypothetical protein AAVH_27853 [Aphelenchus avenae]
MRTKRYCIKDGKLYLNLKVGIDLDPDLGSPLLLRHLLTIAGMVVIIAFSLTPTSGVYTVYREAQAIAAEDARNVEKHRLEWSYRVMEWSYTCTTLDAEGQLFAYIISCHSFATKSNASLYTDVDCKSIGTKPTNAEGILLLQLHGANCTKGNATVRSGCLNCRSPKGIEYRGDTAALYVGLNLLCVYHCVTAICKLSHYRRPLLPEDGQSVQTLRATILSRAWRVYFRIAFAWISLDVILLLVLVDRFGSFFLSYMLCTMAFMCVGALNLFITDETRFVCGLPDSVFTGGQINEAEVKRLRKEREEKLMPQQKTCRLCRR